MIPMTQTETLPIETDAKGIVRVGKTRVTLETLIAAFSEGATPEEIAQQYPSLHLADIYSVIGYYLRHSAEVEAYLLRRSEQVASVQRKNETRFDPSGVRDRLLARRTGQRS